VLLIEEVIQTDSLIPYDGSRVPYYAAAFGEPLSCVYSAQNQIPHVYKEGPLEERVVRLGPRKGGVSLILGAGPMGLLHADMAMMHGPRAIIVSEPLEGRRAQAEHILRKKSAGLGIDLVITEPKNLAGAIARVTDNRGVDDCITALGIARVQEESLTYLARGGVASFFGGTKAGESLISVDTRRIHYDGISMVGSSGGDPSDVHAVMGFLASGEIMPELYVQRVGGLDAALSLVKAVKNQEFFGKGVIYPHVRQKLTPVKGWSAEDERRFLEQKLRAR
jgi:L-iditol 2-dehydrogenase